MLTHALQKTTEFEVEMHNRFVNKASLAAPSATDDAATPQPEAPPPLIKAISSAFDSYMGIYVSLEDNALEDMGAKMLASETWKVTPTEQAHSRVFDSSKVTRYPACRAHRTVLAWGMPGRDHAEIMSLCPDRMSSLPVRPLSRPAVRSRTLLPTAPSSRSRSQELFINLRRSFKRATPLHMSTVLCDLHKVWGRHLKLYAKKVRNRPQPHARLARTPGVPAGCTRRMPLLQAARSAPSRLAHDAQVLEQLPTVKQPDDPSLPPTCIIDNLMQQRVCAVVNTCEYCHETTGAECAQNHEDPR